MDEEIKEMAGELIVIGTRTARVDLRSVPHPATYDQEHELTVRITPGVWSSNWDAVRNTYYTDCELNAAVGVYDTGVTVLIPLVIHFKQKMSPDDALAYVQKATIAYLEDLSRIDDVNGSEIIIM